MCFSAAASFTVAGVNAGIALLIFGKTPAVRERPMAAFPALFAVQQFAEGLLWVYLPHADTNLQSPAAIALAIVFILVAEVVWPILTPIAVLMIEPDWRRRRALRFLGLLGLLVGSYLFYAILSASVTPQIVNQSIRYFNDFPYLVEYRLFYVMAICAPLLLSSQRAIQAFGALVFLGYLMSLYFFITTLISVWCFFAAAACGVLYFHFSRPRLV